MHQETLRYMWHRLPYEKKLRPAGLAAVRVRGGEPPPRRRVRIPAGRATLGADRARRPSRGTTSAPRTRSTCPPSRSTCTTSRTGDFLEFVEAGGYRREELWTPEGWTWLATGSVSSIRSSGSARTAPGSGAGCSTGFRSRRVAGLRDARRGLRVRPLEGKAPPDGARVSPRGLRHAPEGSSARTPGETSAPDPSRGNFDLRRFDPVPVGLVPCGAERVGDSRPRRERLGVDLHRLRPLPRVRAHADLSRLLRRLLRRQALRDERRVARDAGSSCGRASGTGSAAPIRTSTRRSAAPDDPRNEDRRPPRPSPSGDFAEDVRRDLVLSPRQIQSRYLYNALGSALFEAITLLPWYRITRAEGRLLGRWAGEMVSSIAGPITLVELGCGSGEKISPDRAGAPTAARPARRPPDRHLADCARAVGEDSRPAGARLGRGTPRDLRGGAPTGGGRAGRFQQDPRPLPGLEHRQLRSAARRGLPAGNSRRAAPGRRAAARRRPRQARARAAARLRRPARGHGGLQQEPAPSDEHGAAGRLRSRPRSITARSGTGGAADRDAPGLAAGPEGLDRARGPDRPPSKRGSSSGPRAPTSTRPKASRRWANRPASGRGSSGSSRTPASP